MKAVKGIHRGSSTERLLDHLTTDGWWISTSMLADLLPDLSENVIHVTLNRLKRKGWIESRPVRDWTEMVGAPEHEWRVHPDFEWPE